MTFSKEGIFLSHRKHVLDLLEETGLLGGKAASTSVKPSFKTGENRNCKSVDKDRYQRLVGCSYIYPTHFDIVFVVSLISRL